MTRENKLIKLAKQGNPSALDELIRLYYPRIYKYCCFHTKTIEQAEDATQETFYKAVKFLPSYKNVGTFQAFLYKIALNVCIDYGRAKHQSELSINEAGDPDLAFYDSNFENIESNVDFARLLETLTPKQRELVILRFGQNLTLKEVAAVTDSNLRTCQSNLRKALKQIKKNMERRDGHE